MNDKPEYPIVTVLPPGPAPKKLTARSFIRKLGDHLLAFWNHHNPKGNVAAKSPTIVVPRLPAPTPSKALSDLAGIRVTQEMKDLYGDLITSRSAAKSLQFTTQPLQDAEYDARRGHFIRGIWGTRSHWTTEDLLDHLAK